jgi:hypothetical protein
MANQVLLQFEAVLAGQPTMRRETKIGDDGVHPLDDGSGAYVAAAPLTSGYIPDRIELHGFEPQPEGKLWLSSGAVILVTSEVTHGIEHEIRSPWFVLGRHIDDGYPATATVAPAIYARESTENAAARNQTGYEAVQRYHEITRDYVQLARLPGLLDKMSGQ